MNFSIETLSGKLSNAKWIWGGADPRAVNAYRLFRHEFVLSEVPSTVFAFCFAEARYKLYINGHFVQLGPTFCQPHRRLVDRHNITSYLKRGNNCIALVVYCPGIMTGQWTLTNPGLLCHLCSDDGKFELDTNAQWQTTPGKAWRHPTELCFCGKGFMEWHVIADMPVGWMQTGFNARDWESSIEIPFFAHGSAEQMCENYIGYPALIRREPTSLVHCDVGDGKITQSMRDDTTSNYVALRTRFCRLMGAWQENWKFPVEREPMPEPVCLRADREERIPAPEGMITTTGEDTLPVVIHVPKAGHPRLIFDLGVVRSGLFTIEIESESGGGIDLGGDDRLSAKGQVLFCRSTPNVDHVQVPAGKVVWESSFERGLRYLQVVLHDFTGTVRINRVGILETVAPCPASEPAHFECEDELLVDIWKAATETTRLYMTNGCAPGDPVRERVPWFHDNSMAMRMAFYCFGDWRTWRRGLELTAEGQHGDGSFPVISPGHFEDFNMVVGACYWVVQVQDYVVHTGDVQFAADMLSPMKRFIDYELRFAHSEGLLYETPGRRFLSWADGVARKPYKTGETWQKTERTNWGDFFDPPTLGYNAIINSYWLWALQEAGELADQLGEKETASHWRTIFASARPAYDGKFFDHDAGLYRDNVSFDPTRGQVNAPTFCESTLFHLMRTGLLSHATGRNCFDRIMDEDLICCRTSGGLELGAVPPFLIEAGRMDQALDLWKDRWGEPIKSGTTTCGEEFFQGSGNSDCHIHGATPSRDFIEYLAGIRLCGPMWSSVMFAPPADGPDLHCDIPAGQGRISVKIQTRSNGVRVFQYAVPQGTQATFKKQDGTLLRLKKSEGELAL